MKSSNKKAINKISRYSESLELTNDYSRLSVASTVDLNRIKDLKELEVKSDSKGLLVRLLVMFIETALSSLDKMEKAFKEEKMDLLCNEAHNLKGSCGNIGATKMASACLQLEKASSENDLKNAEILLEFIKVEFRDVKVKLEGVIKTEQEVAGESESDKRNPHNRR
jgi:HPt (histidine-containing phosphotransfer) domain-containing protein